MGEIIPWVIGALIVVLLVAVIFLLKFVNLWIQCVMTKTQVGLWSLVGMQLRMVNPTVIVRGMISCNQAGSPLISRELEAHYLAGGNVNAVILALI